MTQRWKQDPKLHSCPVQKADGQVKKKMDYNEVYIKEFLDSDPIRDWESIEGCIKLWNFCMDMIDDKEPVGDWKVLDCGTKDGQFVEYLTGKVKDVVGIEISQPYIEYAQGKGRPVVYGDVCNLEYENNIFDFVSSHHLLGLTSNYYKGLCEMFRVTKPGGYMVTLDNIPGNPRKHFSYIEDRNIISNWLERKRLKPHKMLYYDYWNKTKELVILMEKLE